MAYELITPTTELEAVNVMLGVIGESPVSTIENTGLTEVSSARQILKETLRQLQAFEWDFNTEENYELALTVDGYLKPPSNTLRVDACDVSKNVVMRGDKLYDKTNHTYVFTQSLKVDLVLALAFDELPEAARRYIAVRAARRFQRRILGSDTMDVFTEDDQREAWLSLLEAHADTADSNIFNSYDAFRVIDR